VHRKRFFTAAGLCLAPLVGLALARGSELGVSDPRTGKAPQPVPQAKTVLIEKTESSCGKHGTTVEFVDSPKEAAKQAKLEEKLVLVLHVSGLFEDPKLT